MTEIAGSESGYISRRHGSKELDPHQCHGSGTLLRRLFLKMIFALNLRWY
jgi:hypothetical protein